LFKQSRIFYSADFFQYGPFSANSIGPQCNANRFCLSSPSIPLLIASLTASRFSASIPPRRIIQAGLLILTGGLLLVLATIDVEVKGLLLILGFALIGVGGGLMASQLMDLILSQVTAERTSEMAALMNTCQNLGSSLGTALMGSILLAGLASGGLTLIEESKVLPQDVKEELKVSLDENVRFLSNQELENLLKEAPPEISKEILRINEIARLNGINASLKAMIFIAFLGLLASIFLPPKILGGAS
jgi:MFS family permease